MTEEEKLQTLKKCHLFKDLPDDTLAAMARGGKYLHYQSEQSVYAPGDTPAYVYLVQEGLVRFDIPTQDAQEFFLGVIPQNALFGEQEALSAVPSIARVTAIGDTTLLAIPKAHFLALFESEKHLSQALSRQLAMSLRALCFTMAHHLNNPIEKKLAGLLLHLTDRLGRPVGERIQIQQKLSQDDLAQMLSITRQSVNKYFQAWKKVGWIDMKEGYIQIIDLRALQKRFEIELPKG